MAGFRRLGIGLVLGLACLTQAKKNQPAIEETKFDSPPSNLFYFEDSDVVLVTDSEKHTTYRSEDAGVTWKPLQDVTKGEVHQVFKHPFDNQVAIVVGIEREHWITKNQGESWTSFKTDAGPTLARPPLSFHATDSDRILFLSADCTGWDCDDKVYYTTDGFDTKPKHLRDDAISCIWAKSHDLFTTGDSEKDDDRTLCIVKGSESHFSANYLLRISDDFFESDGDQPKMEEGQPVQGVINIASVKNYLVVAAKSEGSSEMAMYVTDDSETWHRAQFGEHKLEEDAYTLLESTNYSMQVDVMTTTPHTPMGVLFTSNSNGTFFTKNIEHTNRNEYGIVDFEKVQGIQGIVMVNTVKNWEEVENSLLADRELITRISFDDGRTWSPMTADGKDLHLHSVTDQRNSGRIFSSPAPGIVMGVGNTGKRLGEFDDGDTFVSDDAGLTWRKTLDGPHLYEFGDQGAMLIAVPYGETKEFQWSVDHGRKWKSVELPHKIRPLTLTTTPDSTSLKFVLTATSGKEGDPQHYIYSLDLEGLHKRTCVESDFEDWYARVDDDGEPTCIMGHTQMYRRRKPRRVCFVADEFKDPLPKSENCKCTKADYECDYNFVRKDGKCLPEGSIKPPSGACKEEGDTFQGPSGYRLIPGNTCVKKDGEVLDEPVERECKESPKKKPVVDGISSEVTNDFKGERFQEYYYLERCEKCEGDDETVIMRTNDKQVYVTKDHGKSWFQPSALRDEKIVAVYPHQYFNDRVYLATPSKKVFYSTDRGVSFHHFEAPEAPNQDRVQLLSFHPKEKDWLIWTGGRDCKDDDSTDCQTIAHVSRKNGEDWETLLKGVRKCLFVYREDRPESDQLVYCEQHEEEKRDGGLSLFSSSDWFNHKEVVKRGVINFATMAEYIVVAIRDQEQETLVVDTSIDGVEFADAQFPRNYEIKHQQAYTVLDSSTHSVFLHVTENNKEDEEYGSIFKSNSNGTDYVLSIGQVNRNQPGYVDFEKMQGLEGVAIVNVVANQKQTDKGNGKKLKTMITHNDGAEWAPIQRPEEPENKKNKKKLHKWCKDKNPNKCSLNLHGYTERKDPRDTYSSASAVGLMIGVGNVGEFLSPKKDADTFITRDGGITWTVVMPGLWMWEYGDQGSIIVIVKENEPTNYVLYSLNEGRDWTDYQFSSKEMVVNDITTVPSDTSLNFLLWGGLDGDMATVNIDFSGLRERSEQCSPEQLYDWSPKHPLSTDDCLFGHVTAYHRKEPSASCYNGRHIPSQLSTISRNCTCTRRDFECDYNFERQADGSCRLVPGEALPNPLDQCKKNPDREEYYDITGYRRIPLTTCQGGQELDFTSRSRPCPGHEEGFRRKHAISGSGLFFAIVLPIAAAAGVGYWVWRNWDGKFGRIQLGAADSSSYSPLGGNGVSLGSSAFDRDAPWVKYPVLAISGLVAVVAALPMVAGSLWRTAKQRLGRSGGGPWYGDGAQRPFTSRSSFQRGRGDYAVVDAAEADEGQLLGEDSEDEEARA
ncbi:hypothetical protein MBLNU230_g5733t1 [Neophaeotheca triangularis]